MIGLFFDGCLIIIIQDEYFILILLGRRVIDARTVRCNKVAQ
jgi:hypothetical protein